MKLPLKCLIAIESWALFVALVMLPPEIVTFPLLLLVTAYAVPDLDVTEIVPPRILVSEPRFPRPDADPFATTLMLPPEIVLELEQSIHSE